VLVTLKCEKNHAAADTAIADESAGDDNERHDIVLFVCLHAKIFGAIVSASVGATGRSDARLVYVPLVLILLTLALRDSLSVPSLLLSLPSITLRSRPIKSSYGVWGSTASSPRGARGAAPAKIKFGAL